MTNAEAKILARMRRLQAQGRRPELTAADASHVIGCTEDDARAALTELVRLKAVAPAVTRISMPSVWRLVE